MFEGMIIFLLGVTIFYYMKLSSDLKKIGLDYDRLDRMFKNLNYTINSSVKVNDELQAEAVKCEKTFSDLLDKSNASISDLKFLIDRAERIMDDIESVSSAGLSKFGHVINKKKQKSESEKTFEDILQSINDKDSIERV
ncbi:hypothetical protein GUI12_01045 [Anaplasmataceae bacterium AB001_6]|nr:hypothetical protein GUI12_01045 [Anaplasmataceae bacterium AB001_6]